MEHIVGVTYPNRLSR